MDAILLRWDDTKSSRYGGQYTRAYFRSITKDSTYDKVYRLDIYDKHPKSKRFLPHLVQQTVFENLTVFDDNRKIIDGGSDFKISGK